MYNMCTEYIKGWPQKEELVYVYVMMCTPDFGPSTTNSLHCSS